MEILKLRESGVLRKLEEKWWMNKIDCQIATKVRTFLLELSGNP